MATPFRAPASRKISAVTSSASCFTFTLTSSHCSIFLSPNYFRCYFFRFMFHFYTDFQPLFPIHIPRLSVSYKIAVAATSPAVSVRKIRRRSQNPPPQAYRNAACFLRSFYLFIGKPAFRSDNHANALCIFTPMLFAFL